MITTPELAAQARRHAATLTPTERADLLYRLVDAIYNAVKYDNPEGGGLDGRDGPERVGLATVCDAALEHQDATHRRAAR